MKPTTNEANALRGFPKDVADHKLTITSEDGVVRHLRVRSAKTWQYHYEITTTPHHLIVTGDMGDYVLSASAYDMLGWVQSGSISWGYWAQKLAAPKADKIEQFAAERTIAHLREIVAEHEFGPAVDRPWFDSDFEALVQSLKALDGYSISDAYALIADFSCEGFRFDDVYDLVSHDYEYHFYWACLAVQHAARLYGEAGGRIVPELQRKVRRPLGHVVAPWQMGRPA